MYLFKFVAYSYYFIGNGEFWPPFEIQGLESGIHMGNHSGYKAILKKNPYMYPYIIILIL